MKSIVVTDGRTLTIKVSVAPNSAVGPRDVVVTAGNGDVGTCVACFTVTPAPVVTSVSPNQLRVGTTTPVEIAGSGFDSYPVVTVDGSDIVVAQVDRVSSTLLRATISVSAATVAGTRRVVVRNGDGGRAFGSFDVS